jgi:hypothetical protein
MSTARAGRPAEADIIREAIACVEGFLDCLGRGDLVAAAQHQTDELVMIFPPGNRVTGLAELRTASAGRYRHIDKHRDSYEAFTAPSGQVTVYSMGRLFGENRYGVAFDGVRYIDRFQVADGLIVSQDVWNDLAESGVLAARTPGELDPPFTASDGPGGLSARPAGSSHD